MDYTYSYHQMYLKENKYPESVAGEATSQSPYLVYLYEVLKMYLRELAIYILKLKKLGITNEVIKENIIEILSSAITNVEYNPEQFFKIITRLYDDMSQAKELYISVCKRNNLNIQLIKSNIKNPRKLTFTNLIQLGQKYFNAKYKDLNVDKMLLSELYLNIIKSICVHLVQLRKFGKDDEKSYEALLFILSIKNTYVPTLRKPISKIMKKLINADNMLLRKLHEIEQEKYGVMEPTEVSMSTRPNKAILVSGSNLRELELLLEATKDKGIDIYTHGHMLTAHSYPELKAYPHLIGHYGKEFDNYILDFSEFPGVILLTKHSFLNVEKLFRSTIFTTDTIAPKGVGMIKDYNFEPLIQSVFHAEGFSEIIEQPKIKLTLSENTILDKIREIAQKIEKGEIKHFFAIGVSNRTKKQKEYFENFLNLLGNDSFILSFSYSDNNKVLHVQSDYGFPLLYKALDILTEKISIEQLNPIILFTRCETHTFSNLLYMKNIGVNKLYFTECSPSFVNPALTSFIRKTYDVKDYTTPENDLKEMLGE